LALVSSCRVGRVLCEGRQRTQAQSHDDEKASS
jgi:hypothetical protein